MSKNLLKICFLINLVFFFRSQSKASYLAYRRERGVPDNEGSYKRTMSPTARLDDWPPRERDDPVLLRVTPHHPHSMHHHQQHNELAKSHSVDALHQRIEDRTSNQHSVEVIGKLSQDLTNKLQTNDTRIRAENNNNDNLEDRYHQEKRERLSPQSVEVLNDRNRQLERERRKLAASCEPQAHLDCPFSSPEDYYRERSATIEMTSQNVELLNRRNASFERRSMSTTATTTASTYTTTESNWSSSPEISDIDTRPGEKPPLPSSSPPRSPNPESPKSKSPRGAVPRRTGSCSSSGSSSTRSLDQRISPSTLPSRFSPKTPSPLDSPTRNGPRSPGDYFPGRKVSSPTQTDNTGFWDKTNSLSNTRIRRAEFIARRSSSSRSRISNGSSVSSTSSVSTDSKTSSSPRNSPVRDVINSPCVSPQPGIEGLTLVQRTEVVLRVNTTTIDAASQTELLDDQEDRLKNKEEILPEPRKKLPEEIECERLSKDLASQLNPNDKLVTILGKLNFYILIKIILTDSYRHFCIYYSKTII